MIRKHATKQSPKPVLESEQLQAVVTDLTETKEGAIVGGAVYSHHTWRGQYILY